MITIIAGSRDGPTFEDAAAAVRWCGWTPSVVVSGGARGGDRAGELWAARNGVAVVRMLPDWSQGRGAGHARNVKMAERAEALIALWDGRSPGTRDMVGEAMRRGLPVFLWRPLVCR